MSEPIVGQTLGKYRLEAPLGQGGMGIVYVALDTVLQRRVAVKLLPESLAGDTTSRQRFVLEARAAARLNHPNVVTVHEVARCGDACFIAMELVAGGSVAQQLETAGRLDWRHATRIVADVCRGLKAAHAAGLIHRDIKPSNFMIGDDGAAKLADFGLSKFVDHRGLTLTGANTLCGTPMFMSPEQCRFDEVNDLSDIYSLGAAYYTLLVGRPPYEGEQPVQVMFAHCSSPVPDPRNVLAEIPEPCARIVRLAMAKNPADRFPSAAEMLAALEVVLAEPTVAPPLARPPIVLSPAALSPVSLSPAARPPVALSPAALSPAALSPAALSPAALSPAVLSPAVLSPAALSPIVPPRLEYPPPATVRAHRPGRKPRRHSLSTASLLLTCLAGIGVLAVLIEWRTPNANRREPSSLPRARRSAGPSATVPDDTVERAGVAAAAKQGSSVSFRQRVAAEGTPILAGAAVSAVAISADGRWLVIGQSGGEGRFRVIDLDSGAVVQDESTLTFDDAASNGLTRREQIGVWAAAISPNGDQLILGVDGPSHGVWALRRDGPRRWQVDARLGPAPSHAVAYSSQGEMVAAAFSMPTAQRERLRLWDTALLSGANPLKTLAADVTDIAFVDHVGVTLVVGDQMGDLTFFSITTKMRKTVATKRPIASLAVSPDQQSLAVGGDGRLEIWDMNRLTGPIRSISAKTRDVAYSPDGSRLFTAGSPRAEHDVGIWDAGDLRLLNALRGHTESVNIVAVSRDGKLIASGSDDRSVRLWNIEMTP